MNRKLHNTLSALMATGAALAIGLMIAVPAESQSRPATARVQLAGLTFEITPTANAKPVTEARIENLARRIERADKIETLAEAAALTAEIATVAALASAFDAAQDMDARSPEARRAPTKAARYSRQTVVMPYFSFSPRG